MNSNPTPPEVLEEAMSHPLSGRCWRKLALNDHECQGRLTWEHAMLHGGKKVNEVWALVRLCSYAHSVSPFMDSAGIIDKNINRWIALSRITDWEEVNRKYPRTAWEQDLRYLVGLHGRLRLSEEGL
jgi:hypothetical protein